MIEIKVLRKMFFISSRKLFLFSRYSNVFILPSSLFPMSAIAWEDDRNEVPKFMTLIG